jgi:peptide/nickel transport system permease protein
MGRYVIARLSSCVLTFFAVTLLVFIAFYVLPRQPQSNFRTRSDNGHVHGSVAGGYVHYVWAMVRHGDLGNSYTDRQNVRTKLFRAAPVTLSLVVGGMFVWLLFAIPIGILSALRPRSLLDRAGTVFVLIGLCAHPLWLGLILSYFFGRYLHVFPPDGYCSVNRVSTGCEGLSQWTYHLVLPWITFGIVNAAFFAALVRALVIEELGSEYVRTARAKGVGEFHVLTRHLLKNVSLPVVTLLGIQLGTAIGTVVFIESAYNLPGLGGILRQAAVRRDLPTTAGSVVFLVVVVMFINLVVDLAYALIDPRIRLAGAAPGPASV